MIPSSFFILPQYQIVQSLGLLNSLPALFLPNMFSIFGTFLLRQFFMALPNELEDAARIDGCSRFMIFVKIMLPLVRSGLIALGILTLRFAWNDLIKNINQVSLINLILGGVLYSLGTIFYSWKICKFNHMIWHIFVILGSVFHFLAV